MTSPVTPPDNEKRRFGRPKTFGDWALLVVSIMLLLAVIGHFFFS